MDRALVYKTLISFIIGCCHIFSKGSWIYSIVTCRVPSGPFILHPLFLKGVEKWFKKSGSRNLVWEIWFEKSGWPEKKVILYYKSTFFQVGEKWLTRKKKIRVWLTTFLEPLFFVFLEKWLQIKWLSQRVRKLAGRAAGHICELSIRSLPIWVSFVQTWYISQLWKAVYY